MLWIYQIYIKGYIYFWSNKHWSSNLNSLAAAILEYDQKLVTQNSRLQKKEKLDRFLTLALSA